MIIVKKIFKATPVPYLVRRVEIDIRPVLTFANQGALELGQLFLFFWVKKYGRESKNGIMSSSAHFRGVFFVQSDASQVITSRQI